MPKITQVRPILLSAPYADMQTNLEVLHHLPSGYRTCGMVEITLDDGTTGLGEGYLAVFAPQVFEQLIHLLTPLFIGRELSDYAQIYHDMLMTCGYWSLQGAAQHAISAVEIALWDCRGKVAGVPVYKLLESNNEPSLKLYASGGDSLHPDAMAQEFEAIQQIGIETFKIRARKEDVNKARWSLEYGAEKGIQIAIDMTQNLAIPSQSVEDVIYFSKEIGMNKQVAFIEEALGPDVVGHFPELRSKTDIPIAGGEIVTTYREMEQRIKDGYYDIVQPDATVIGGIQPTFDLFKLAGKTGCVVYVHCWGGPVGMMANYHAAIAGGGEVAELPLPQFPLRNIMTDWHIEEGHLHLDDTPGLGVQLTPQTEQEFAFRSNAVYSCLVQTTKKLPDSVWI